MTDEHPGWGPYRQPPPEPAPIVEPEPEPEREPFTLEKGKEQVGEAVDRVKQAGKEVSTRPIRDAVGTYVSRAVEAIIGFAEGIEGKARKKKQ